MSTSTSSSSSPPPPSPPSSSVPPPTESPSITPSSTGSSTVSSASSPSSTGEVHLTSSRPTTLPSSTTSTSSTSTQTPSPTPTPSESKSTFLSVSNGNVITVTTVVRSTPSSTAAGHTSVNKGFFDNTGAVAGTFTAVGLVGLGILIFIIVTIIRRRRAERFDKDVALAAAEAAATAHNPDFDDYGYGSSSHGVGGYGYADTYHQDPVSFPPPREAYGMSDIGPTPYADPDNYSVGAGGGPGAAGIGAGGVYRSKSGKNQPDPFNAYAVPHDPVIQQQQANLRYRNPAQDHREDRTLGGGGYDVARKVSQLHPDGGMARSKSLQSNNPPSLSSNYSTDPLTQDPYAQPPPTESYLNHYRQNPQPRPLSTASTGAYGGITPGNPLAQQPPVPDMPGNAGDLPNPFSSQTSDDRHLSGSSEYEGPNPGFGHDDPRMSLGDDEDYGAGRRVLKVANE